MLGWGGWGLPTCNDEPAAATALQGAGANCLYDVSNPAARTFLWDRLKASCKDPDAPVTIATTH